MFKKIALVIGVMMAVATPLALGATISQPTYAAAKDKIKDGVKTANGGEENKDSLDGNNGIISKVINTMLFIVGILSVIVIIVAGIYYITSTGDAGRVKKAKDALMYAIVGLIVAILAYAIVNFVIGQF